jgi:Holliday junction DNA helicase RuvA
VIGLLRGRVLARQPPRLLVDVQGVGYEVDAPMTTFYELPEVGAEVILYTHLAVREDAHTLYGFLKLADRELFRNLLKVNGVGARLALGILSGMDSRRFIACVRDADADALVRLPGIGKKTAERLIIELRDRLPKALAEYGMEAGVPKALHTAGTSLEDAVSALVGLGYKPQEASRMVRGIDNTLSSEEIIRRALQASIA